MNSGQQLNPWGQIVAKAWQDDAFKKRLLANPMAVLKEQGLQFPAGVELRLVENTDRVVHLTIPAKPREGELSDDNLENAAGGALGGILKYVAKVVQKELSVPRMPRTGGTGGDGGSSGADGGGE